MIILAEPKSKADAVNFYVDQDRNISVSEFKDIKGKLTYR